MQMRWILEGLPGSSGAGLAAAALLWVSCNFSPPVPLPVPVDPGKPPSSGGKPPVPAGTAPTPAEKPSIPAVDVPASPATDAGLPVVFQVVERAGVARPDGLVEGGVPLSRGVARDARSLRVTREGSPVPARFEPLAWWDDGSLRWAKLSLPVSLAAGETASFRLDAQPGPGFSPEPPAPPSLTLELVTNNERSAVRVERGYRAALASGRAEVDVEVLTARRLRVRVRAAELAEGTFWKSLALSVASPGPVNIAERSFAGTAGIWSAVILDAGVRGPKSVEPGSGGIRLYLYPPTAPPYPADPGFHVTHEIVLERDARAEDLALRVAKPLRIAWPPAYMDGTGAMGRTGAVGPHSARLDAAFREGWQEIRARQQRSENQGWVTWGDFFDGEHGLGYAGYLNQEYDPATAFFLYHARSGDPEALDSGVAMARQYADSSVGLDGRIYQHRATVHALEGHLSHAVAEKIRLAWRKQASTPASEPELLGFIEERYGKNGARNIEARTQAVPRSDPSELERRASELLAHGLIRAARQDISQRQAARYGLAGKDASLRGFAEFYRESEYVADWNLPPVDELFAPFFQRYGGSWSKFPAFHFYDPPDDIEAHSPTHALVEMLVWGHLLTGDPLLRRTALEVAHQHLDERPIAGRLVERGMKAVVSQREDGVPVSAREAGWPLINLLSLAVITEKSEPELHARIERALGDLVKTIISVPPRQYQGTLHAAVVAEGLARYHERTGDPRALQHLIDLARYWSANLWDARSRSFREEKGGHGSAELSATFLYGLTYAAWKSGDADLARRAREVAESTSTRGFGYPKAFAQQFRNSQRAFALPPLLK